MATLRGEDYEMVRILHVPGQPLRHLAQLLPHVEVDLFVVLPEVSLVGMELRDVDLRARTGAAVLAVVRVTEVIHNPPPTFRFEEADQVLLIGSREQLAAAFRVLRNPQATARSADATSTG
jgi:CPA2 family monovalent cation:H+ antiporter-2